jgi:hypothetical protein
MKPFFLFLMSTNWGFGEFWWMELDAVAELVNKLKLLYQVGPIGS